MKLTLSRDALVNALAYVTGAVERRATVPILSTFLLSAADNRLSITGTNLDVEATASAEAEVEAPGKAAVAADVLAGFARKLPADAPVTLEALTGEAALLVSAGRARLRAPVLPAEDFPLMGASEGRALSFSLPAGALERLITQTRYACSTEESRYYLGGVFVHVREGDDGHRLACAATDGHRLAYADAQAPEALAGQTLAAIVPRHTCALIAKLVEGDAGDAGVVIDATHIRVIAAAGELCSKLIDGTFPDYQRIVPRANANVLTLKRGELTAALSRVLIVANERAHAVRLSLAPAGASLSVRNPDRGEAVEDIDAAYAGAPLDIGFNGRLLADALGQLDGDEAHIALADAGSPALLRSPSDAAAFAVLMPLRV